MSQRQSLGAISPSFIVRDVPRAIRFYVERLGFEVRFSEPADQPFVAIVGRDAVQIFLKSVPGDIGAQPNHTRHEWVPWDAFVFVQDPDLLAAEFTSRSLSFHRDIMDRKDGLRGFEVSDEDDYVLFFGRPNN